MSRSVKLTKDLAKGEILNAPEFSAPAGTILEIADNMPIHEYGVWVKINNTAVLLWHGEYKEIK
jgi:hypothetical protein